MNDRPDPNITNSLFSPEDRLFLRISLCGLFGFVSGAMIGAGDIEDAKRRVQQTQASQLEQAIADGRRPHKWSRIETLRLTSQKQILISLERGVQYSVKFGLYGAIYSGLDYLLERVRQKRDAYNIVVAATLSGSIIGARGGWRGSARGLGIGTLLGGIIGSGVHLFEKYKIDHAQFVEKEQSNTDNRSSK
eukprot:TRINITY_DN2374_c0_g1_i2.p1 TRINITY_DN2374_c0_g1~~TRINITY_DN2374_c0_g1_i2.p1  ORF type:complete len:191 (+),score=25.46 TRINITY_DN2374_c0_g1_i2:41-613(+)